MSKRMERRPWSDIPPAPGATGTTLFFGAPDGGGIF
jgi:hypothetical protein